MKRTLVLAVLAAAALSACNDDRKQVAYQQPMVQQCGQNANGQNECVMVPQQQVQPQVVQQAPIQQAPVVVQAAQSPVVIHDNSGANMATGMALGMMAGSMMNNNNNNHYNGGGYYDRPRDTVVNKTVVNKTVIVNQAPAAPGVAPKAVTVPTPAPAPVPVSPVAPITPPKPTTQTLSIPPKASAPVITTSAPKTSSFSSSSSSFSKPSSSSSSSFGGFKKR